MRENLPVVAIVGQTNVGKSSLSNAIAGFNRSIVARESGTTRDSVFVVAEHKKSKFWLADTAGLKKAADEFEQSIQDQILDAASSADITLVLVEAGSVIDNEDEQVARIVRQVQPDQERKILVINKSDKIKTEEYETEKKRWRRLGIENIVFTSAIHKTGVAEMLDKVVNAIPKKMKHDPSDLKIAFLGRPNVGKSSMFNSLAERQQAVVADVAGTTRDINSVRVKYHNKLIELLDTAGIRRPGKIEKGLEQFSVLRTLRAIEMADICVVLIDSEELLTSLDQKIIGMVKDGNRGLIVAVSKWDKYGAAQESAEEEAVNSENEEASSDGGPEKATISIDSSKIEALEEVEEGDDDSDGKTSFSHTHVLNKLTQQLDFTPWAPVVFTSAVDGKNLTKIFELATEIQKERSKRISTPQINNWLANTLRKHEVPSSKGRLMPKIQYAVQESGTDYPSFKLFGNHVRKIHWSYKRYLETSLRREFGFNGTPLEIWFIQKEVRGQKKKTTYKDKIANKRR